jgi:hypothetical protein
MKTMNYMLMAAIVALPLLSACKEETKKVEPATKEAPVKTKTQVNTPTSESTGTTAMNPAHGQPNHRCDIPVGAPLNSPPANANTQQSPLINSGSSPATGKVNPPHGQPGHRCDIKVGDPL